MASLRQHPRSPFWYLKRRELDTGKIVETSTGLRADSPADSRKAQRMAEKATVEEQRVGSPGMSPAFEAWVPQYIRTHWLNTSGDSQRRYQTAWQALKLFLNSEGITYPRQIRYAHADAYIRWRMSTKVHNVAVGHNTALLEIKFLSQLMNEAIKRDFSESNPIAKLGIGRAAQKVKPELTDAQLATLAAHFRQQNGWMYRAFMIGLYTGCRFSECEIPREHIDLENSTLRLTDSKRNENDPRKYFTVPMDDNLRPLMQEVLASGEPVTCSLSRDKNGRINYEFRRAGVKASFHSLRVTFVTRCHRNGISLDHAMKLVNHSSQLIHRIYSRLTVDDVRESRAKLQLPSFGTETP